MQKCFFAVITCMLFIPAFSLLAADSPTVVYEKYLAEQKAGNLAGMCKYVTEEKKQELERMDQAKKTQMAQIMKMSAPQSHRIIGEDIQGDKAMVRVQAKSMDIMTGHPSDMMGVATFVKEGDEWKLSKEDWRGSKSR